MRKLDIGLGLVMAGVFLVAVCLLAAYLSRVQVHDRQKDGDAKQVSKVLTQLLYKRRLAELLLDLVLLTIAYYGAYRLRFDGVPPPEYSELFQTSVGIVIGVKIAWFGVFSVYRGSWRYMGIGDLYRLLAAIGMSYLGLVLYANWQLPGLESLESVLFIDALLSAALVMGSRLSFRSLEFLRRSLHPGQGVVVYGAGDAGELAIRELLNNKALHMKPVCFLDDDSRKHGSKVHGVPVIGGVDELETAVIRYGASRILISTRSLPDELSARIRSFASQRGMQVLELYVSFRPLLSIERLGGSDGDDADAPNASPWFARRESGARDARTATGT
jgi:UDP-GlcNAc:undecaprenyl-phosphate GlcNAc-1-phosphate transferase